MKTIIFRHSIKFTLYVSKTSKTMPIRPLLQFGLCVQISCKSDNRSQSYQLPPNEPKTALKIMIKCSSHVTKVMKVSARADNGLIYFWFIEFCFNLLQLYTPVTAKPFSQFLNDIAYSILQTFLFRTIYNLPGKFACILRFLWRAGVHFSWKNMLNLEFLVTILYIRLYG